MAKEMESFKANSFDQDLGYDTDLFIRTARFVDKETEQQ